MRRSGGSVRGRAHAQSHKYVYGHAVCVEDKTNRCSAGTRHVLHFGYLRIQSIIIAHPLNTFLMRMRLEHLFPFTLCSRRISIDSNSLGFPLCASFRPPPSENKEIK